MAKNPTVLEFEVSSTDEDRKTIEAVRETIRLSGDLQNVVAKKYPGVKVEIRRKEGLPVHALVHHILVSIDWHAVAKGAETAIAQFATSQFLSLAKDRVRNMFVSPATALEGQPKPAKKGTLVKKASSTKKAATKKVPSAPKSAAKKLSAKSKESGRR
jgi:pantoate kinase